MSTEKKERKPTMVVTGVVRLSYAHIYTPQSMDDGEPKYGTAVLIPKTDTKTIAAIEAAVEAAKEAGKAKWGGKIPRTLKLPLRDGDVEKPEDAAYVGHMFLSASSRTKPTIVNRDKVELLEPGEVYSGCYVRASLNFYAFDTKGNKGVGVGLNNLQKWRDGEALAGGTRAEDDFDDDFQDEDDLLGGGDGEAADADVDDLLG